MLPDVDVKQVAQELFWAAFRNNGQVCIAIKRLYVHVDIYDTLRNALVAYARTVTVGRGAQQGLALWWLRLFVQQATAQPTRRPRILKPTTANRPMR